MTGSRVMAVAAVIALAFAGCGSKDKKQLSKAQFVTKADAICTKANQTRKTGGPSPTFNPATATAAQLRTSAKYLSTDVKATSDEVAGVKALGTPKQDGDTVKKLVAYLGDTLLPADTKLAAAAKSGDTTSFRTAFKTLSSSDRVLAPLETKIGFKVCGK